MSDQEGTASASASTPGEQSSQDLGYSPVPAEEPDHGSGAIQPGHEQAGQGGYTGASGYTGHSDPDVEGQNYPASITPLAIAADLVLGPVVGHAAAALGETAGHIAEGAVLGGGIVAETVEMVEHSGEGASGPEQQSATANDELTGEATPQEGESTQKGGATGSTSDGAGYSAEGQTPVSSTSEGTYIGEADDPGFVQDGSTMLPVGDGEPMPPGDVGPITDSGE
jgi:hypothetical protein